jgi:hypothetical protein
MIAPKLILGFFFTWNLTMSLILDRAAQRKVDWDNKPKLVILVEIEL